MTDIPDDLHCALGNVAPDRQQMWVNCSPSDNYLVDLATFTATPYPNNYQLAAWSSNSRFARLADWHANDTQYILSVQDMKIQPLPVQARTGTIFWHPSDSVLTYISAEKQTLVFLDASTMAVREFTLPQPFRDIIWKPNGEGLALLAEDGSLWQVDYPNLENLEPLTPALPEVRDLIWSPDGTSIAFVSGSEIYIVDTMK
jgi:WD40 repeat protein